MLLDPSFVVLFLHYAHLLSLADRGHLAWRSWDLDQQHASNWDEKIGIAVAYVKSDRHS